MGLLPLQFLDGENALSLGLDGTEHLDIEELTKGAQTVTVNAATESGPVKRFSAHVRIDTPKEWDYYRHGGILRYLVRQLAVC